MKDFFNKTLGGLTRAYYIRQLFFAIVMAALFMSLIFMEHPETAHKGTPWSVVTTVLISVPLYPYSRFIYETAVDYILGKNMFILPALMMLIAKFITMIICFFFAIFIAPVGLAYLYYHHSKAETVFCISSSSSGSIPRILGDVSPGLGRTISQIPRDPSPAFRRLGFPAQIPFDHVIAF